MRKPLLWLVFALLLCLFASPAQAREDAGVFVAPVEGLAEDFVFAADISSVLALEKSGVVYYDFDGAPRDLFALLRESGWTAVRVRVWNDPFDAQGRGYGGGNNDVNAACEIARRAAQAGLRVIVDFHYSDFWADPGKQMCPKAWRGLTLDEKADALYAFTLDALARIAATGADISMVQVGNETDNAMAGETEWTSECKLLNAGSRAVRQAVPGAKVAVHFSQPIARYAQLLQICRVDYDVFAASYYPYWHGTLDNMQKQLTQVRETYGKEVFIAETAYPYTLDNGDMHGNSIPDSGITLSYALTVQGQANALRDITQAAAQAGCFGVAYWEPAWLGVPGDDFAAQSALWEAHGAGWASSFAAEYDPEDAGAWYGGSSWDNQAFFDFSGRALPTLRMPAYLRQGASAARAIDSYETRVVTCYIEQGVVLPDTVDALYNDGSREPVAVVWHIDTPPSALGEYTIDGTTADGRPAVCLLTVTAANALQNPGFELEDMSMWRVAVAAGAETGRRASANDTKSGQYLFHFYDTQAVDFTIEQEVKDLLPGAYDFSLYIHGGDAAQSDMCIYVLINGEPFATCPMGVTKWREFQRPAITGIPVAVGDVVTVGARVACSGSKPWGKLDDFMLALSQ